MEGYDRSSYGEAFADVYDDWYQGISDVDATVATLLDLAGSGPVLELGVGTGRLAVPLAIAGRRRDIAVTGVDSSVAMLDRLRARDPAGAVELIVGDMVDDLPAGPFSLVFVAYNTLFNLTDLDDQRACFRSVAARLAPGGRFVVEAFVPDDPPRHGDEVTVRSMTAEAVVLSATRHDPDRQRADGQFIELRQGEPVRLRPWSIRYSTPDELDAMADAAGLTLERRWASFERTTFDDGSSRHVTAYRKR